MTVLNYQSRPRDRCGDCAIRHSAICAAVGSDDLRRLNAIAVGKHFPAGHTILSDEEPAPYLANIVTGVVKLTKLLPDGRQQIVGLQFPSDFLGRAFRENAPFHAEAVTDVELCCLPRGPFEKLLHECHDLEDRLLRDTLDELDAAREWLVLLGRQSAGEKVAKFLSMIARSARAANGAKDSDGRSVAFDLPLTRADIADFLGLTIETVSRQMTKLKTAGVISIERNRHITVPDLDRLNEIAEG